MPEMSDRTPDATPVAAALPTCRGIDLNLRAL